MLCDANDFLNLLILFVGNTILFFVFIIIRFLRQLIPILKVYIYYLLVLNQTSLQYSYLKKTNNDSLKFD